MWLYGVKLREIFDMVKRILMVLIVYIVGNSSQTLDELQPNWVQVDVNDDDYL